MDEDMRVYVVLPSPSLPSFLVHHNLPFGWAGRGVFLEKSGHKEENVNLKIRVALDQRNVNSTPAYLLLLVALTNYTQEGMVSLMKVSRCYYSIPDVHWLLK